LVQEKTYKWIQARLREIDSGTLSEKDLARLKEIALEDPFVADALEGFHAHPYTDHADHLTAIEDKINVQKRARRRWLVPNLAVTAIAACLLLLIGAYAVIMRMDNEPSETLFVFVEPDSLLNVDSLAGAVAMEASPVTEGVSIEKANEPRGAVLESEESQSLAMRGERKAEKPAAKSTTINRQPSNLNDKIVAPAVALQEQKSIRIKGQVVDAATKEPLAFSPYLLGYSNQLAFTDGNGNFEIESPEKEFIINLKHKGYGEKTMVMSAATKVIALNQIPGNEIAGQLIDAGQKSVDSEINRNTVAYFAFRNFIDASSTLPLGTGVSDKGKKVVVEFVVLSSGRPSQIKITESTGDEKYDAEAIRLVSYGPDWVCVGGEESCKRSYIFYFQ
jgi:hypothetical protein